MKPRECFYFHKAKTSQAFDTELTVYNIHWAEAAYCRINSLFGPVDEGFKTRTTAIKPI